MEKRVILGVIESKIIKINRKEKKKRWKEKRKQRLGERYRDSSWKHQRCVTWSAKKIVGLTCSVSLRDAKWLMGSWTLWRELMGSLKSFFFFFFFSIHPLYLNNYDLPRVLSRFVFIIPCPPLYTLVVLCDTHFDERIKWALEK